ncbi:MAG: hypothetical protein Q9160_002174 [Pyrenula sp. 1 TL-2023]
MLSTTLGHALFTSLFAAYAVLCQGDLLDPRNYPSEDIIHRDVAIVGGGSSGIYSAVRLTDYNKSVIVVEKQGKLGGHAETYTDPATNMPIDLGVVVWPKTKIVTDYFARFDLPLINISNDPDVHGYQYFDFSNSNLADDFQSPSRDSVIAALAAYEQQLNEFPSLQHSFDMSYPVAPDILLPFGEFINKHHLSALMYPLTFAENQGYSPLANLTTLYMLKYLNAGLLDEYKHGALTTAHHNSSELYARAGIYLGASNILLNANITSMSRSTTPIKLSIRTPQGPKLILATKLLTAIPPIPSTLTNFDLSPNETSLFTQFVSNGYASALLNDTSLPPNTRLLSLDPSKPFNIPSLPGVISLSTVKNTSLTQVFYGSDSPLPAAQIQDDMLAQVAKVQRAFNVSSPQKPGFVAFTSHAPFNLMVSPQAIASGFYRQLYALQGQRNTFWVGAAWQSQDSEAIWEWVERELLGRLVAAV